MPNAKTWTHRRIERLRRLWTEGRTASEIARILAGGITRNAVLGKIHRLGLAGRGLSPRGRLARPEGSAGGCRRNGPAQARVTASRGETLPDERLTRERRTGETLAGEPRTGLETILSISRGCRWPMGDPQHDGFRLCGRPVARGAYCAAHALCAYQPFRAGGATARARHGCRLD